ncbi:hypothetical protein [Novosphingobium sp. PhB165]|uniref:hypothetical protein n=1 Tax=Novosphingobium sp. PhB165 TaxID=2485105 RepID=UPI0014044A2E|nr:hypothetical protein [Novosphingobium sp. PhB165]
MASDILIFLCSDFISPLGSVVRSDGQHLVGDTVPEGGDGMAKAAPLGSSQGNCFNTPTHDHVIAITYRRREPDGQSDRLPATSAFLRGPLEEALPVMHIRRSKYDDRLID